MKSKKKAQMEVCAIKYMFGDKHRLNTLEKKDAKHSKLFGFRYLSIKIRVKV